LKRFPEDKRKDPLGVLKCSLLLGGCDVVFHCGDRDDDNWNEMIDLFSSLMKSLEMTLTSPGKKER